MVENLLTKQKRSHSPVSGQNEVVRKSMVGDEMRASLLNAVRTRALRSGDMLPSQSELAQQFKIGEVTVRRTLSQLEAEGLISRERGRGTFITQKADTLFKDQVVAKTVLLAVRTSGHLFSDLLQKMILSMQGHGYIPSILGLDDQQGQPQSVENLAPILVDAVKNPCGAAILEWPDWGNASACEPVINAARSLVRQGIPVMWLLADPKQLPQDIQADVLTVDYASGMELATKTLIDGGHKRIAFLAHARPDGMNLNSNSSTPYFQGYKQAMRLAGLQRYSQVIVHPGGDDAEEFAREVLTNPDRPTAIVACQDYRLMNLVKLAPAYGIKIPDDLALIGFNNTPWAEMYGLSSVDIRLDLLAEHAVNWLRRISSSELGVTVSMLKPKLVLRKSVKLENP